MFDFSFGEMVVILVVALVVLGPERLPKVAKSVGRWAGQARRYMRDLTVELERETQVVEIKKQIREAQRSVDEATRNMDREVKETAAEVDRSLKPAAKGESSPVADKSPPET